MEYNVLLKEKNEGLLASTLDGANGKLIIACNNSFVVSSIMSDFIEAASAKELLLYNGNKLWNDVSDKSDVVVICTSTASLFKLDGHKDLSSYMVALMKPRDGNRSSIYDIELSKYSDLVTAANGDVEVAATKETSDKYLNDIKAAVKSHNVVFVQNLDSKVIEFCETLGSDCVTVENSSRLVSISKYISDIVVISQNLIDFSQNTYYDDLRNLANVLREGGIVICDTTWVNMFIEMTSIEDDTNLISTVIYNNPNFGPMGNEEIYNKKKED